MLDLALTPDQEQLVATVRDFSAREFAPTVAANDREGHHDPEIFAKLASIGLPGVCFPQRYGGHGLDYLSLGLVCEELEYVDTTYRTVLSVHVGLVGMGLDTWADEDQKQRSLVPMCSGPRLARYCPTHPHHGSHCGAAARAAPPWPRAPPARSEPASTLRSDTLASARRSVRRSGATNWYSR